MINILFFVVLMFASISSNAKTIILNIPDDEIKIVENDVPNANQWIINSWNGKVASCKERIVKEELKISVLNGETVPAGEHAIIEKYFRRPDYKNRQQRDLEGR